MKRKHVTGIGRLQKELKRRASSRDVALEDFRSAVLQGGDATLLSLMKLLFGSTKHVTKESLLSAIERFRNLYDDDEGDGVPPPDLRRKPERRAPLSSYASDFDDCCAPACSMNASSFSTFFRGKFSAELFLYITSRGATPQHIASRLKELVARYHEERRWRRSLEKHADTMMGSQKVMMADHFGRALGLQAYFASRVFALFDATNSGCLGRSELCSCLLKLTSSCREEKLRFLFRVYDADGDGALDRSELELALRSCSREAKLTLTDGQIKHLTTALFSSLAPNEPSVKFDEVLKMTKKYSSIYDGLGLSIPYMAIQRPRIQRFKKGWIQRTLKHVSTYPSLWLTYMIYATANVAIFGCRLQEFLNNYSGPAMTPFIVAKCAGRLLDFNVAITLIFTGKHIVSWLKRMARVRRFIPLDDALLLHRTVAYVIVSLSIVHIVAHVGNIAVNISYNNFGNAYFLEGPKNMIIFVSGVVLTALLALVMILSYSGIVSKCYELFYWSHNVFYVLFYVAMFPHASSFWKWFIVPAIIFALEKAIACVMLLRSKSEIVMAKLMSSEVVYIELTRPACTKVTNGDYIKLNIPSISRFEWHPFTISSSMDNGARIGLHVRAIGNWTRRLQQVVAAAVVAERRTLTSKCSTNADSISFVNAGSYDEVPCSYTIYRGGPKTTMGLAGAKVPPRADDARQTEQHVYAEIEPYSTVDLSAFWPVGDLAKQSADEVANETSTATKKSELIGARDLNPANGRLQRLPAVGSSSTSGCSTPCHYYSDIDYTAALLNAEARLQWKVYVDGPFATPCASVLRTEHAVLIAGGVGVTPHANALEALLKDIQSRTRVCGCGCGQKVFFDQHLILKRMDFIWLTKDQSSWDWFMPLFRAVEEAQDHVGLPGPLVRLRLYLTSSAAVGSLSGVFLQLALRAAHQRDGRDAITGLRARLRTGRPEWPKVLKKLKDCRAGRLKIFCCGPVTLTRELSLHCRDLGVECASETF